MEYSANDLKIISPREHVRARPAMYIGDTTVTGLHACVSQLVSYAFAEPKREPNNVWVKLRIDGSLTVQDDGPGFEVCTCEEVSESSAEEVSNLEVAMTQLLLPAEIQIPRWRAQKRFWSFTPAVVNFLAAKLEVTVNHGGKSWRQSYRAGNPMGPVAMEGDTTEHGITTNFQPDPEIFQTTDINPDRLGRLLKQLAFLHPGVQVHFDVEATANAETFCFNRGLADYVEQLQSDRTPLHSDVIRISGTRDDVDYDIAFQYANETKEIIHSFVNGVASYGFPIEIWNGGTHVAGFRKAVRASLEHYGDRNENCPLSQQTEPHPVDADYFDGLTAVVSVSLKNDHWENAMRSQLGNPEVETMLVAAVTEFLDDYWKEHPHTANAICNKVVNAAQTFQRSAEQGESEIYMIKSSDPKSHSEKSLVVLPDGHSRRLYRSNGGRINLPDDTWWTLFPVFDEYEDDAVEPRVHVKQQTFLARELPGFPNNGIVIGRDEGDRLLVLLPGAGKDWWRYRDEAHRWDPATGQLYQVLDDLSQCEPRLPDDYALRW